MNFYQLMNKDSVVLEFSCSRDEFDEPVFSEVRWLSDLKPIGFTDISSFLERRKAPKHREHIAALLSEYECNDVEGFIQVTHAASLNDTFWVRSADSTDCWKDVSLFRNDFNKSISRAAFEGIISGDDGSLLSPEFTTDGAYAKCWVREKDGIFLYKAGSRLHVLEPLSEFLAAQLSGCFCKNSLAYTLDFHNDTLISKCALFTDEEHGFAPMSRIFRQKVSLSDLLSYYSQIGCGDDFRRMCILDALIFNTDRHYGNFGVMFNSDTMDVVGMAPVFDNNRSLFYRLDDDTLSNPSYYVRHATPRLGPDFNVVASRLLTSDICSELKNLSGFKFEQHPEIVFPQERLDRLSELVNRQIDLILGRIPVKVAVEQGRYNLVGNGREMLVASGPSLHTQIESASARSICSSVDGPKDIGDEDSLSARCTA